MILTERVKESREKKNLLYSDLQENPMNLDDIFQMMVDSLHYNYPYYEQKRKYYTPAEYKTYIFSHYRYNTLTFEMLVRSLHQLTGDMHDRNLTLHCDDWVDYRNHSMKYRVRAYGDYLYVTSAAPETRLVPGDKIVEIHRMTPERIRVYTRENCFYSREKERELWGGYLRMAEHLLVEHADGSRERMNIPLFPAEEETYPISFEQWSDGTAYLKFECMDRERISACISEHKDAIARAKTLVIDLTRNAGGEEGAGWELFPYLIDEPTMLSKLIADEGSYMYYTRRNTEIRYHQLEAMLEQLTCENADDATEPKVVDVQVAETKTAESEISNKIPAINMTEDTKIAEEIAWVKREMQLCLQFYGKGFIYRLPEQADDEMLLPADQAPEKIILLTDTFCEKEGEQLAAMIQRCGRKVTTIGRPTMGTLDTFDTITIAMNEHMSLTYPIRLTKAAYEGKGISEKGLPVDRYISWTPAEIEKPLAAMIREELKK